MTKSKNQDNCILNKWTVWLSHELLTQNYEFSTISQPHFAYNATHNIHNLNKHRYQSFDEGSISQRHIKSRYKEYEIR